MRDLKNLEYFSWNTCQHKKILTKLDYNNIIENYKYT